MDLLQIVFYSVLAVVSTVFFYVRHKYSYWKRQGVPYVQPNFPYGSFKEVGKTVHMATVFQEAYNYLKNRAPYGGIFFFFRPAVIPTNLDFIKTILIKDFNYFTDRGLYYNERDEPLSAHLFLLDGLKWKSMRHKVSPTFTSGKMKYMFPTIVAVAEQFQEALDKQIGVEPEIDISDYLARYSTDVIGTTAFGIDCNSLKDPNTEFRIQGRKVFTVKRNGNFVEAFSQTFQKLSILLGIKDLPDEVHDFFFGTIKETVKYREEKGVHRNDFLDLLLKLKNETQELTIEQIAAQAFVFFAGGFETSATAMSFCLFELARHEGIQDKLREEIINTIARHDGKLTYEAMNEMKFLEQVVNETLRMHPPAPSLIRKAVKDYPVEDSLRVIENGTLIFIPVQAIHMDPDIHRDPEVFDPNRFSPGNFKKLHSCAFLPFGDGPRNCIGLRFAKMQTYIGLVALLGKFKFSICSKTQIPVQLNVNSPLTTVKDGIILKVEKI